MTVMLLCPILAIDPRSRETVVIASRNDLGDAATMLAQDPATANDALFLRAVQQSVSEECLDAVTSLRAWIEAETSAARLRLMQGKDLSIGLILPLPPTAGFSRHDKLAFLGTTVEDARLPPAMTVVFGTAYVISLCVSGEVGRAYRVVQHLARRHDHALLRSAEDAITRLALGKPVPDYLSLLCGWRCGAAEK